MKKQIICALMLGLGLALFSLPALAQSININLGDNGGSATAQIVRLIGFLTIITLAPSILIMMTPFVRIVVVFSLLRSAIGTQQTPPNSVLISLSLFLTMFIMTPTFEKAYEQGVQPLIQEKIEEKKGFELMFEPFHEFMVKQTRDNDIALFLDIAGMRPVEKTEDLPYRVVIPAFMISELRRAFEIGFLIFIPFLIIDMMVSSILMSMGMMMLPPVLISLPFKIIFFVLVDGWHMLSESLVKSFY